MTKYVELEEVAALYICTELGITDAAEEKDVALLVTDTVNDYHHNVDELERCQATMRPETKEMLMISAMAGATRDTFRITKKFATNVIETTFRDTMTNTSPDNAKRKNIIGYLKEACAI